MKVEIIHWRDPDSASDIAVFIDGKLTTDAHLVDIDPGRGWCRDDWEQMAADSLIGLSPAARELAREWWDQAGESPYIDEGSRRQTLCADTKERSE